MSQQRALVRIQLPQGGFANPGQIVDWEGLDWKLEPLDRQSHAQWEESLKDDERVLAYRRQFGPHEELEIDPACYPPANASVFATSGWRA